LAEMYIKYLFNIAFAYEFIKFLFANVSLDYKDVPKLVNAFIFLV